MIRIIEVLATVPFERFWSMEFVGTMLSELLIPIIILVGSSIAFGVWGKKSSRIISRITKHLSIFLKTEAFIDGINDAITQTGERMSKTFRRLQTGLSYVNILFLMGGVCLLLFVLVIL